MNSHYNVPIIPPNLRREETIVQIADALQYLSEVADDVFKRINIRIGSNTEKLSSIQERITEASAKIEKLAGEKRAVRVFSSSKYPASDVNRTYIAIFGTDKKIQLKRTKYKYKETNASKEEISDRIEYYHVRTKKAPDNYESKGLGKIPEDVESVGDLLLYNTGKNLYQDYVIMDALESKHRPKQKENKDILHLNDAPLSLIEQNTLKAEAEESYFYSPDLGEVPILEVPLDLPDLPGIADDLRYENQTNFGIAPSVALSPSLDLKPVIVDSTNNSPNQNVDNGSTNRENQMPNKELSIPPNTSVQSANKIEITPEKETSKIQESVPKTQEKRQMPIDNNVPTDTPKQHEIPSISNESSREVQASSSSHSDNKIELPPVINNDAHASLMEAIRKAGGTKNLKATASKEVEKTPKTGGDLMADLHAKLSLRRKGISGTKKEDNVGIDASSTLAKIADLIPPPLPASSSDGEKEDTEDDEWDD